MAFQRLLYCFDGLGVSHSGEATHPIGTVLRYNWDWLRAYVLPWMSAVVNTGEAGVNSPAMKKWIAEGKGGKKLLMPANQAMQDRWLNYTKAPYNGVVIDEFVPPIPDGAEGAGFTSEVFDLLKTLPGSKTYCWCGMGWQHTAEMFRPLFDVILPRGSWWLPEFYVKPSLTVVDCQKQLQKYLIDRMMDFRRTYDYCESHCIVGLYLCDIGGYAYPPTTIDWKVWLDMQMQIVATHPAFFGIAGVAGWALQHATPDTVAWWAALNRHYFTERKTCLLSERPLFLV